MKKVKIVRFSINSLFYKKSLGEKGDYMTKLWKNSITPYLNKKIGIFITLSRTILWFPQPLYMESETVDYLFNSCRDHTLDEFNTGTYLNDKLLQNSINNKKQYFDFLKGEEKYKFNFGRKVHQLYDLRIKV